MLAAWALTLPRPPAARVAVASMTDLLLRRAMASASPVPGVLRRLRHRAGWAAPQPSSGAGDRVTAAKPSGGASPAGPRTVIVGGYGHVGSRLARRLVVDRTVVIAGRHVEAACVAAESIGAAAGEVAVDARTGAGLAAVAEAGDLIVNTSGDQPHAALLRASIERGCDYVDVGADASSIAVMLDLDAAARAAGLKCLVGAGWAPGVTNILARAAAGGLVGAEHVDVIVAVSVLDEFGPAALEWTIGAAVKPAPVAVNAHQVTTKPFSRSIKIELRGLGPVTAFEFVFPEQYFLPDTLPIGTAAGWCGFQPPVVGWLLAAALRRPALSTRLSSPRVRGVIAGAIERLPSGGSAAKTGVAAIARRGDQTFGVAVTTAGQAHATAAAVHLQIDHWRAAGGRPGVHLPESVIAPTPFLEALAADGMTVSSWHEREGQRHYRRMRT